jgi:hypothetical protein
MVIPFSKAAFKMVVFLSAVIFLPSIVRVIIAPYLIEPPQTGRGGLGEN